MVEVRKNTPPPQPPETFDLLGLSREQAELIRDLTGKISVSDAKIVDYHSLYNALYNALDGKNQIFEFEDKAPYETSKRIGIIRVRRR